MPMIRLLAKHGPGGGPLVPNYEAQSGGTKRFIGRKLDPNQGTPFQDPVTKRMARHAVFVAVQGPEAFHEIDASTPRNTATISATATFSPATRSRRSGPA